MAEDSETRWGSRRRRISSPWYVFFILFYIYICTVLKCTNFFLGISEMIFYTSCLDSTVPIDLIDVRAHDSNVEMLFSFIERAPAAMNGIYACVDRLLCTI